MHRHWRSRVAERIGPDVDPDKLARKILRSIARDDGFARFKRKQHGARVVYQFDWDGERRYVVVDFAAPEQPQVVTILPITSCGVRVKPNKQPKPMRSPGWKKGKRGMRKVREGRRD